MLWRLAPLGFPTTSNVGIHGFANPGLPGQKAFPFAALNNGPGLEGSKLAVPPSAGFVAGTTLVWKFWTNPATEVDETLVFVLVDFGQNGAPHPRKLLGLPPGVENPVPAKTIVVVPGVLVHPDPELVQLDSK